MLAALREARIRSGEIGESIARQAAELLANGLENGEGPFVVSHYHCSSRLSTEDKKGIDLSFTVFTPDWSRSVIVPIQVKTSKAGAKRHLKDHPDIPCIVVKADTSVSQVIAEMKVCINNKLYGE